ncbi:tetratricopeptide repeat protein [Dokdonella sp.]|uniref:O-linked N-acetylglucosamine transferase, SPINDLY family protein n=1 Tax=Dokdonella sp. TaxID=2291710 RepID=UPI002636B50B|nr:tetratricopeptide repeat protein [Dokdonella sp.]
MNDALADTPQSAQQTLYALITQGRLAEAEKLAAGSRGRFPADAEIARLHAIALLQLGRPAEAHAALLDAQRLAPDSIEVLCNLGSVLLAAGDAVSAVATLEHARKLAPAHPAVLNGLGNAHRAAGDLAGAREAYAAGTRAAPDYVGAWLNLAAAELALGDHAGAERDARHALTLAPGHPEGLLLLGHVLGAQGRHAEAETAYAAGMRASPRDARFPYQLGLAAEEQKKFAFAAEAHAHALSLDPNLHHALGQLVFLRRQLCDWRDLDALSASLRARVDAGAPGIAPFGFLSEPADAAAQLRCARNAARDVEANAAPLRARLAWKHTSPAEDSELRVGFASNGFGRHPTGLLTVAMFEALRDAGVHVELFATTADDGSDIRTRLRSAAHAFHDCAGDSALALAQRIRARDIEILVDLRGWGGGNIADTLALRPAPVQVGWLAYPGTTGAPWIDYAIADRIVLPDAMRAHFSERIAWLPRCFQPSDPTRVVGDPPSRRACGLPEQGIVYACFNNSYKINPATLERLLSVLRAVPDSVLWLLSGPERADERLRMEAQRRGVAPERLVFMAKQPHAGYLARYRHADLFLDTAPYGAHTTASDAIWAGCPVLTVAGGTFASRVAASLNHHLGLPQLIASDGTAFVDAATCLGRDATARAALRAELAERRQDSGLFDMHAFARDFAMLLRGMASRRRAGLPPAAIE